MKTQSTPGPWVVRNTGTSIGVFGRNGTEQVHCDRNTPQQEANARLIASAPELLGALEAILANPDLSRNDWDEGTMAVLTQARTAIAKAKGETL